ncbi:MAG: hypothetical protein Q9211_003982 [Gyalolechia sp. 1 TL-2023]
MQTSKKNAAFPGSASQRPQPRSRHDLLRTLLVTMGADISFLRLVSDFEAFQAYPQMLNPKKVEMPLPDIKLPSQWARSSNRRVPRFSEVMWPVDDAVVEPGGITGFFRDFYNMSVRRPYRNAPEFEYIRIMVNPEGITSKASQPKCLIFCSTLSPWHNPLLKALVHVRAKQGSRGLPFLHNWTPLHDLMDCISVIYQQCFARLQGFVQSRLKVLRDMQFQGRVHPWRSKFQFLLHLEDQVAKSRDVLLIAHEDLEAWNCAEIHGVELAAIPYAEWHVRVERLKRDASYLLTSLDHLSDRQSEVHVMLKEQVDLNSGTRSLLLAILASVYIPLAFVSSYFGMNTHEITQGGILSVATYWKVSVPLVVASIFIPVAFSGLLIRTALNIVFKALNIVSAAASPWGFAICIMNIIRIIRRLSILWNKSKLWWEWFNKWRKPTGVTSPTHHEDSGQAMEGDVTGSVAMA